MAKVCVHLVEGADEEYARFFSGVGIEHALVCRTCRGAPETIEANLRDVSPERFNQIEEAGYWEWDRDAILGRPEVLVRPTGLSFRHEQIAPDGTVSGRVWDLKPISTSASGEFVVLLEDGDLLRVDPDQGSSNRKAPHRQNPKPSPAYIGTDSEWDTHVPEPWIGTTFYNDTLHIQYKPDHIPEEAKVELRAEAEALGLTLVFVDRQDDTYLLGDFLERAGVKHQHINLIIYCPFLGSKNPRLPGDHFQYVGVSVASRVKQISGTIDE